MTMIATIDRTAQLAGAILGTAVGDAIGLPREGLSRQRARRIFGDPPLHHALIGRWGMTSDDTEHTCMAAQALLASHGHPDKFGRSLAWRLRGWLLGLPAGVGMATARAVIKLWMGFSAKRSGVWSAGNGPAMRAAILGAYAHDDSAMLRQLVHVSTRLTHTDPAAEHGALAVALAAAYGSTVGADGVEVAEYLRLVREPLADTPMLRLLEDVGAHVQAGDSAESFFEASGLGRGISGYINHTVPAAVFCWLKWPGDMRTAVEQIVIAGGDSDTTGAIVGGLVGATAGANSIPSEWLDGLIEWPRSVAWMRRLASALADDLRSGRKSGRPLRLFWPGLIVRNALFLLVVIVHGFRRMLPPY